MILNSNANVKNGSTLITRVSGDNWLPVNRPAFFRASAFVELFMIAEVDSTAGNWIQLCRPYTRPTQTNVPVMICMDYTPEQDFPIGNIGDVDMADLYNRAMLLLDRSPQAVPLHGPSHVGLGLDPIPLASTTDSGLLGRLSGHSTDYVGGDNICHSMAGVPTGTMCFYAGTTLPANWLWCNGGPASRSVYSNLHSVIGDVFGAGDGLTYFMLPDARGMTLIGAGAGQSPATTNWPLAYRYGEERHVLTQNELASHGHPAGDNGHTHAAASYSPINYGAVPGYMFYQSIAQATGIGYASISVGSTGGNWAHNNMQPSLAVNVIIKA